MTGLGNEQPSHVTLSSLPTRFRASHGYSSGPLLRPTCVRSWVQIIFLRWLPTHRTSDIMPTVPRYSPGMSRLPCLPKSSCYPTPASTLCHGAHAGLSRTPDQCCNYMRVPFLCLHQFPGSLTDFNCLELCLRYVRSIPEDRSIRITLRKLFCPLASLSLLP